jgi:mannose-1-phosphate guanylyltransferase
VGKSLLRLTFERFLPVCAKENMFVITNVQYRDLVLEQIPEISAEQVLCEPSRNNTAPCIAYAAFKLAALDPKANMVVTPADHIVLQERVFTEKIQSALDFSAAHDALVTLGIEPSRPDTGYGYIQFEQAVSEGVFKVSRFAEKPGLETARHYLSTGSYLWNAGIFIWRTEVVLDAFRQHAPEIYSILERGVGVYNTEGEQAFIDAHYPTTPNISVDYALMENAGNVFTLPASFGWSDLGTWASLYVECPKDAYDNVLQGNIMAIDCDSCLMRIPEGKLMVAKALSDYIIVDTQDVLLIYPKSMEQEIKQVTGQVRAATGETFL